MNKRMHRYEPYLSLFMILLGYPLIAAGVYQIWSNDNIAFLVLAASIAHIGLMTRKVNN